VYVNICKQSLLPIPKNIPKTGIITIYSRLTLWLDSEKDLLTLLHGLHSLGKRRAEVT
jgi:hypothetical protein